jgi:ribosomal protein L7Ae-like RNA K-turn-binding protein
MYSKYLDSLIRQNKTGIKHATKKTNKKKHKENVIVSDCQEILYKDIQEIYLIINYIMLSIKWSQ